ncbi:MAG: dephospho-CoA kinase [Bacteroidia bacterium]|nr:dephospho-CoA kinase [Bacteroidia bacterium]
MLKIGLTGNIGSGKSYIGKLFSALGIPVYNSDGKARLMMDQNSLLMKRIKESFGEKMYPDGLLDTQALAAIAFESKSKIELLNSLVHPFVRDDFEKWCRQQQDKPYAIIESAIVFESGFNKMLDKVITVTAPQNLRMERVKQRDGMTEEKFHARQQYQLTEEVKAAQSDFVIRNDGFHPLLKQITDIDSVIRNIA